MNGRNGDADPVAASLHVLQSEKGYRYSIDPFLLVAFAAQECGPRIADLGTGSGIIPLLLAVRSGETRIVGIEIQTAAAERARCSVALNGLADRVDIVQGDIRLIRQLLPPQSFAAVLANPPYRKPGAGRVSPRVERGSARHELHGGLVDFVEAARFLLPTGGRFYLVYLPERLAELLALLQQRGLEPKRLRCVYSRPGDEACLVLVEARRGGGAGLLVEPALYIYEGSQFTSELQRMLLPS